MERKQEQEKSFVEEAAMGMEASSSALRSLLHRMAQRCAGYLGLAAPLASDHALGAGGDHLKPAGAADGCVVRLPEEFTVVQYVPCSVRSHLAWYIKECRALAIRRSDTDIDLVLHNSEALDDMSETQRQLVDNCFYNHGITLNYHQIMVVRSLKEFVSISRAGSLTLEITLNSEDDDISVSIPCSYFIGLGGRMMLKKEVFGNFLLTSSIEVNNLVLITFKECEHELAVVFSHLP
ncbi:dna topoisomerase 2 [Hordeum vulgare]|nr:dna topoisomerase 2 [Hordeum vulgare]